LVRFVQAHLRLVEKQWGQLALAVCLNLKGVLYREARVVAKPLELGE
jgi:hypothetical protein